VWCAALVRIFILLWKIDIVHGQSHVAAGVAARALRGNKRVQLVFDVHGVDIEESLTDGRLRDATCAHRVRLKMQRLAVSRADWLLPVSETLGNRLASGDPHRIRIVPCVLSLPELDGTIDEIRRCARERLTVDDRPVVLYLGGASPWQRPRFMVECFCELLAIRPDAVMLIISGNPEAFAELLESSGVSDDSVRICSLPHQEVAATAAAADVGMLLREETLINRVASPTKFAEYLAAGVPVVLADILRDFAAITRREKIGAVVPATAPATDVAAQIHELLALCRRNRAEFQERCMDAARRLLSFDSILDVYREIYSPSSRTTGTNARPEVADFTKGTPRAA
jgi:glycosyltransferase involved in cell wall biosynthesis